MPFVFYIKSPTIWCTWSPIYFLHQISYNVTHTLTYFSSSNLLQCDVQLDAYAHLFLFHVKSSTTWCTCSHISVLHKISYNLTHMLTYFCSTSTIIWCTTWCICSPISHRIITILTFYVKFSSQLSVGVLLKSVTYREGSVNSHAKIYAPSKVLTHLLVVYI